MADPYGLAASGIPPEQIEQYMQTQKRDQMIRALMEQSNAATQPRGNKGRLESQTPALAHVLNLLTQVGGMKAGEDSTRAGSEMAKAKQKAVADAMMQYSQTRQGSPGIPEPPEALGGGPGLPATAGDPRKAIEAAMMNPAIAGSPLVQSDMRQMPIEAEHRAAREARQAEADAARAFRAQESEATRRQREDQAEADRAFRAEQAKQRADSETAQAKLVASLRAPPAQQPLEAIQGPDGKPTLVSREDAIGKTPTSRSNAERNIPAPVLQAMSTNEGNVRRAQQALSLLEGKDVTMKGPDGKDIVLKGDKNATGVQNYMPDALVQRTDSKGVDARAVIGDLGSMVIHDRSGAAVTASEFPRLKPFIPLATDDPDVARKKLKRFVAEYTAINNDLKGMFSEDQGYRVPGKAAPSGVRVVDW